MVKYSYSNTFTLHVWVEFIYLLMVWVVFRGFKQYFPGPWDLHLIIICVRCTEKNRKSHTDKSWELRGHAELTGPQMSCSWVGLRLKPTKECTTPATLPCIVKQAFMHCHYSFQI